MSSPAIDVLVVIRAPLEMYPPTLLQVSLLSEADMTVGVADCTHPDYPEFTFREPGNIVRFRLGPHILPIIDPAPPLPERIRRTYSFKRRVGAVIRKHKPKVVIACDPYAMIAAGSLWKKNGAPKLVWHFHELFLPNEQSQGWLTRHATAFACAHADRVDLVIFPDAGRAEMFKEVTGKKFTPQIVNNCPRRVDTVPESCLRERLRERGVEPAGIVYFQGTVGPSRRIEPVIKSIHLWPDDACLVLVGPVSERYRESLLDLARQESVVERVVFLGAVPYQELASLTSGASVGLAIVTGDDSEPNWKFCAGAVNKRFEYMAVGVPQIANKGPGMKEIIEETGCGLLVDPDNPDEIGRAVSQLLSDGERHAVTAENARRSHRERFCYEVQFAPMLERIRDWVRESG